MSNRNKRVTAFLASTRNKLPRDIQETIVKQMNRRAKYANALDIILQIGGRRKNLMYHGFFNPENYDNIRNYAPNRLKQYNASKNKIVNFVMDNNTALSTKDKKKIVYRMLTSRTWDKNKMVFVNDLKYVKTQGDLDLITKTRKESTNRFPMYMNISNLKFSWRK